MSSSGQQQDINSAGLDDLIQVHEGVSGCFGGVASDFCRQLVARCLSGSHEPASECDGFGENDLNGTRTTEGEDGSKGEGEEEGLNYTKIVVLSIIILLTIIGNICVILAIVCR